MITKIQKWGNSLGVRIPKTLAQEAAVEEGLPVNVTIEDGRLVVAPIRGGRLDLQELLAQITPDNLHGEVNFGKPTGREIW